MGSRISSFGKGGRKGKILLLAFVGFTASACITSTVNPTATPMPSVTIAAKTVEPTVEAAPTATPETEVLPTENPVPTLSANLTKAGPWLVLNTTSGIVALNPDGSGLTKISAGSVMVGEELQSAISPGGAYLAYITSTDSRFISGLTLNITALPAARPFKTIALTSPQTEPGPNSHMGDPEIEIVRAITEFSSLAWSHDGRHLAFIGAQSGPSADLYEYNVDDDTVMQLTNGPSQAYRPIWSPDDRYIVHTAVEEFGTGAGASMSGIYAARSDGSEVVSLYDIPANSGDEIVVGWLDADTFAVETWLADYGPCNLRLVSISKQKVTLLHEGYIHAFAADPAGGSMVYSLPIEKDSPIPPAGGSMVHPLPLEQDTSDLGGLYIVTAVNPIPTRINGADIGVLRWSAGIDGFFAREVNGTIYEISATGEIQVSMAEVPPLVSPDGAYWAFDEGDGMIRVARRPSGGVADKPVAIPISSMYQYEGDQWIWSPDGQSLYAWGDDYSVYRIQAPDWTYQKVVTDVIPGERDLSLGWGEAG